MLCAKFRAKQTSLSYFMRENANKALKPIKSKLST